MQLSSMSALTNKTSSQSFFLRVLKVIIQLREAALHAMKKNKKARLEAEAFEALDAFDAANRMVASEFAASFSGGDNEGPRTAGNTTGSDTITAAGEEASTATVSSAIAAQAVLPMEVDDPSSTGTTTTTHNTPQSSQDKDKPSNKSDDKKDEESGSKAGGEEVAADATSLQSLSDQLALDALWETLSACLRELADTPDHHAVLVLQPTVEAFFLVHAAATSNQARN